MIFSLFRIVKNTNLLSLFQKKYYFITLPKLFFDLPNEPSEEHIVLIQDKLSSFYEHYLYLSLKNNLMIDKL
jgi:hypothetical protein